MSGGYKRPPLTSVGTSLHTEPPIKEKKTFLCTKKGHNLRSLLYNTSTF